MPEHNYETRWFFWDGARNVSADPSQQPIFDLADQWLLAAQPAAAAPPENLRLVSSREPNGGKLRILPPTFVQIRKCDRAFKPVDELFGAELQWLGGEDATLFIRIYADKELLYQRQFTAAEIRRMPQADIRTGMNKMGNPHVAKSTAAIKPGKDPFAGARGTTITIRAWARPYGFKFDDCTLDRDWPLVPGYRDPSQPADAPEMDILASGEHERLRSKAGGDVTGLGRNQATTTLRSKVQFVGFRVAPGCTAVATASTKAPPWTPTNPQWIWKFTGYKGTGDLEQDLAAEVAIMKAAIEAAAAHPQIDPDKGTLKIFMAPEFFFRGGSGGISSAGDGGMPIERLSGDGVKEGLFAELRKLTNDAKYADWMFVLGTAVAYLRHDYLEPQPPPKAPVRTNPQFKLQILNVKQHLAAGGFPAWTQLDFAGPNQPAYADLKSLLPRVTPTHWQIIQQQGGNKIVKSNLLYRWPGAYSLGMVENKDFIAGDCTLVEGAATEILNSALVQRGGPPPASGLSELIVYKESISSVDFVGDQYAGPRWDDADLSGRVVKLHGEVGRRVLPVEGASGLGGTDATNTRSEWNRTGIGGGGVFIVDGITFGLEICLDHGNGRLQKYYQAARPGEPKVQVQLVTAAGKEIVSGSVCAIPNGLVFNVDGRLGTSEAVINDNAGTKDKWKAAPFSFDDTLAAETFTRIGPRTPVKTLGALVQVAHAKFADYFSVGKIAVYEALPVPPQP